MVFKRKIYNKMLEWKAVSHGESALMIEGARRIGKSTIAIAFAKNEYEDYMVLDFARESKDVRRNFEENIGELDVFFRNLFLLKGRDLPKGKSVIIFDEVQLFPPARQAIKFLVQDGRYDYIETSSLISIKKNVKDILLPSEEFKIKMFPMDFEEFLWAKGDKVTAEAIRYGFEAKKPMGDAAHRKIMQTFRTYMAVGGMPQAVSAFVEGRTYREIDFVKRNILSLYEEDLKKNNSDSNEKASVIFKTIPEQLSNRNSHFRMAKVEKNARYQNYIGAIDFVAESMIGNLCVNTTTPEVALELHADRRNFKLYMGDTGLLISQIMKNSDAAEEDLYKSLIFDRLGINQGMIMENMVAQMLRSKGYELYFHEFEAPGEKGAKPNKYEIDFLLVRNKKICPIEVKSSGYKRHKSFDMFAEKYRPKMQERYIICAKDLSAEEDIIRIPLYMTMCL